MYIWGYSQFYSQMGGVAGQDKSYVPTKLVTFNDSTLEHVWVGSGPIHQVAVTEYLVPVEPPGLNEPPGMPGTPWAEDLTMTSLRLNWDEPPYNPYSQVRAYRIAVQVGEMTSEGDLEGVPVTDTFCTQLSKLTNLRALPTKEWCGVTARDQNSTLCHSTYITAEEVRFSDGLGGTTGEFVLCGVAGATGAGRDSLANCYAERHSFLSFPSVCPEPVLVKCSFLHINGAKSGVSDLLGQRRRVPTTHIIFGHPGLAEAAPCHRAR